MLALKQVHTLLHVEAWTTALHYHPNQWFVSFLVSGLCKGFRIGFNWELKLASAAWNLPSASEQKTVLDRIFQEERTRERFISLFQSEKKWQINRVGVIPKGHTQGK